VFTFAGQGHDLAGPSNRCRFDRIRVSRTEGNIDERCTRRGKNLTVASCSNVHAEHRSHVVVSGSYGGRYNAFNAARWPVRAVIMNDAGIGKDKAGIVGLDFLDQIDLAAATADARTCHIGDGDHMLAHGIISYVNRTAAALGCTPAKAFGTAPSACARQECRRLRRHRSLASRC
jgi:hypothetical protein